MGGTCWYNLISCKALVPTQNNKERDAKLNLGKLTVTTKHQDLQKVWTEDVRQTIPTGEELHTLCRTEA